MVALAVLVPIGAWQAAHHDSDYRPPPPSKATACSQQPGCDMKPYLGYSCISQGEGYPCTRVGGAKP